MGGDSFILRKDVEVVASLLDGHQCILFGGASLPFYGVKRGTIDVDIEVQNVSRKEIDEISSRIIAKGIEADVTGDSSGWGMIPLPEGYRDRTIETGIVGVSILDPIDFVLSKMRRGIDRDVFDSINVSINQKITEKDFEERLKLVVLPLDPVSGLYLRRMKGLYVELQKLKKKSQVKLHSMRDLDNGR